MSQTSRFDTGLMQADLDAKGWMPADLAKAADVAPSTVGRFLAGQRQTARVCKKLAKALGHSTARYVIAAKPTKAA